jgi:NADPH2:quinone reductase
MPRHEAADAGAAPHCNAEAAGDGRRLIEVVSRLETPILHSERTTMRAQILKAFGGPENFVLTDIPTPVIEPGKLLIRLAATSVNQIDIKIRGGLPIGPDLPAVLGADVAGVIEAVGDGVIGFVPGDEVYGCAGGVKGQGGAFAEYILADARLIAPKPRSLSMREAAALPLVAITAWDALERCVASASDHVLIHGGVGGVGHVAIQLAKTLGARVATTVPSAEAAALAKSLGADETINFRTETPGAYTDRLTAGRGFDVIIDTIGGDNLPNSFTALAHEGRIATTNTRTTQDLGPLHAKAASLHVVFMLLPMLRGPGRDRHGRILRSLARMADSGKLRPLIDDSRFTLETAPDAHRRLESGKAQGKVVIDIADQKSASPSTCDQTSGAALMKD